ncbi:calcium homeostasis modulator protein 5-like isoform X2 [Vanacampus margaritifer]
MDKFQTVLRFFMNQKATIGYSFMALLTIGGERVFSMVSFQCPCNHDQNFAYGLTFLLGPAAVLLVLGLFFSARLWRLYTGCCLNPMKLCPRGRCFGCFRVGLDDNLVVDLFCKNKTMKCREELARVPCGRSKLSDEERMDLLLMFRAQSQILGWCIIIIAATFGLLGTCYTNCRSKVSFLQLTFWKRYVEKEKEHFDAYTLEYASKLAERNLQSFFENKDPDPFPFPNHKSWEEISALYTFSRSEQYYSTLQRYVERIDREFAPEKRPVLDLEHGIEMK